MYVEKCEKERQELAACGIISGSFMHKKLEAEMGLLDPIKLRLWSAETEGQSMYLIGSGTPKKCVFDRMMKEQRIRSGECLFVIGVDLAECGWCLMGNPWDRVKYCEPCLICKHEFGKTARVKEPYELEESVVHNAWKCQKGHTNSLENWYCNNKECYKDMSSVGSLKHCVNDEKKDDLVEID